MFSPDNNTSYRLAADIGNSRLKIYDGKNYKAIKYEIDWLERTKKILYSISPLKKIIAYSSVNNEKFEELRYFLKKNEDITYINALENAEKDTLLKFSHIEGIGSDRIFGMLGALIDNKPPLFTADCGTAVTVNAVDENYNCIGGAIFAGAESQNFALGRLTSALNPLALDYTENAAGETTAEAMKSGIIRSCAGGIRLICEEINKQFFHLENPPLFLTGGSALIIYPALRNAGLKVSISKCLVLKGIYSVFENKNMQFEK